MYKLIRTLLPVLAAMIATTVSAQSVSWKSSVQHLDGQTYRIVLEASIPAPWDPTRAGPTPRRSPSPRAKAPSSKEASSS